MAARAGIVVTGTEVLTGQVSDRNGPWVAQQLLDLGVDVAHIDVVGDRPEDLEAALGFLAGRGVDLIVTSGGLGPTADDLTADVVARFQGRPAELDTDLEGRIAAIVSGIGRRAGWDPDALALATRKQAYVPADATVLEPVGTAPGLVVPVAEGRTGPTVLVLPGPPRELQGMWPAAVAAPALLEAVAGRVELREGMLRLYGTPESEIAATLREVGDDALAGLEVTTCLRGGELEVATRYEPSAQEAYDGLVAAIRARHGDTLFSDDGSTVDDQVVDGLLSRGWTIATAESCTGGLLAGRLTERPGSSAYVLGGVAAYSNSAKTSLVGVPASLIESRGAVSVEVAASLASGARTALGADVGVGITGVAGPGGGTPEKPVGFVCFSVAGPDGAVLTRALQLPGGRADVRGRSLVVAMHLVRALLAGESD